MILDVILNCNLLFKISIFNFSLLTYRDAVYFCILTLYFAALLNPLTILLGFGTCLVDSFIYSFPIFFCFIIFAVSHRLDPPE